MFIIASLALHYQRCRETGFKGLSQTPFKPGFNLRISSYLSILNTTVLLISNFTLAIAELNIALHVLYESRK